MRLYLLALLADADLHGYQVMRGLKDRFDGRYVPSAGSIYPRLRQLQQEGLVDAREDSGRIIYHLTPAGVEELRRHEAELEEMDSEIERRAGELISGSAAEVRASARNLRREMESEARQLATGIPPFQEELRRELARFSGEWAKLVPAELTKQKVKSVLRQSLQAAVEELRRALESIDDD